MACGVSCTFNALKLLLWTVCGPKSTRSNANSCKTGRKCVPTCNEDRCPTVAMTASRSMPLLACADSRFEVCPHHARQVKALSEELENPDNTHRWRKLEGSDPGTYEMVQKIQALQKRLIMKTEVRVTVVAP